MQEHLKARPRAWLVTGVAGFIGPHLLETLLEFLDLPAAAYMEKIVRCGCLIDVKSVFDPAPFRKQGLHVWRL
jgi:hypothetical protein